MFLYTNNELLERNQTISFIIASKRIKYLGMNLAKEVKEVHIGNYKTLMKEIEEDTNTRKDVLCSGTGRFNIVQMSILASHI